jgi:hypothetical protein
MDAAKCRYAGTLQPSGRSISSRKKDDGDASRITDELFEFIAVHDDSGGVDVLDLATLQRLDPRQ